ncbi:MAG: DnaA regulatory inactivator Hda [Aromatoleum sp.]|nr:DnaA regulatory inactivator Hda [Aromatoleum sp.]
MEQLVLDLAAPEPPSFANFVPGPNAEALGVLARFAAGAVAETGVVVWGAAGSGKTHLLHAAVAAALAAGRSAIYVADHGVLTATEAEVLARHELVAVDSVDAANADAQGKLFSVFNALRARGRNLLAASSAPPAALPLREDVRTRLGWGLVFEILPLADSDKPAALVAWAQQRGFGLSDDVIRYLLAHGRRDMASLLATLAALDRHSLATKRAITVPLLRDWIQRDFRLER